MSNRQYPCAASDYPKRRHLQNEWRRKHRPLRECADTSRLHARSCTLRSSRTQTRPDLDDMLSRAQSRHESECREIVVWNLNTAANSRQGEPVSEIKKPEKAVIAKSVRGSNEALVPRFRLQRRRYRI